MEKNELVSAPEPSFLKRLFIILNEPMTYILVIAAVVSIVASSFEHYYDAIVIMVVVFLNGMVGIFQEGQASQAVAKLKQLSMPRVKVIREGNLSEVEMSELVVGDYIILSSGDMIPADARLIEVSNVRVDES